MDRKEKAVYVQDHHNVMAPKQMLVDTSNGMEM